MARLTVIVQPDEPAIGRHAEIVDWPLHVTVLQAFTIEVTPEHVVQQVLEILRRTKPLAVTGAGIEHFGPAADIEVTVLSTSRELVDLHHRLLDRLSSSPGFRPDIPAYSGDGYRPHVTACNNGSLRIGDEMHLQWGAIVDMEGHPEVIAATPLYAAG